MPPKMNSKIEGNTLGILRRSFFPFNALGMPSFNNSAALSIEDQGTQTLLIQGFELGPKDLGELT